MRRAACGRCFGSAAAQGALSGSPGGVLKVGDAGNKGRGVFAARTLVVGELLLRVSSAQKASSAALAGAAERPQERRQEAAAGAAAGGSTSSAGVGGGAAARRPAVEAYVLDAAPPPPQPSDEEEAETMRRFPFLRDPRAWPMVAAPRAAGAISLEALHSAVAAPFVLSSQLAFAEHGMLNHSCCPEAIRSFDADTLTLRAARVVESGQEVSDTYFYPLVPHHLRAKACEAFGFECHCPRCRAEAALPRPMHVWSELTWANGVRLLGEVARARAAAKGNLAALQENERVQMALQQMEGLVATTGDRLTALELPEADLSMCLGSWAALAAAVGDLRAALRGDLGGAAEALQQAAQWAEPAAPAHALSFAARALAFRAAIESEPKDVLAACFQDLLGMRERCLGSDVPTQPVLGDLAAACGVDLSARVA